MAKTIIALYDDFNILHGLMQELLEKGIERNSISLVAHDEHGDFARGAGIGPVDDTPSGVPVTGMAGGLLSEISSVTMPGVGRIVLAGPMVSALRGTGGAKSDKGGGLLDALTLVGVPDHHGRAYVEGLRRGGMLVLVQSDEGEAEQIAQAMNHHRPVDLNEREKEWRASNNWKGFDGNAEPFAFQEQPQPHKKRAAASRLDYGPGANEYLSGQPVSDYDRKQADMSRYKGEKADTWHLYESSYRAHFQERYASSGKRWEEYRDAYRFGFDLAQMTPYMNQPWEVVRGYAAEQWSARNMGTGWDEYEDAVHAGWEVAHVPH